MKTIKRYVSLGLMLIRMGWQSQISYMGFSALLSYVAQIIQFASRFGVRISRASACGRCS